MPDKQPNLVLLKFENSQGVFSDGMAEIEVWTKARAKKKGRNICFVSWICALFSIPIPILHFFTVPGLLLAGPLAGYFVFKLFNGSEDIVSGSGHCPSCKNSIILEPRSAHWPLQLICKHCRHSIIISQKQ